MYNKYQLWSQVEFDLNLSMDKVHRYNYNLVKSEKLDKILTWILMNRYKFAISPPPQQQQQSANNSRAPNSNHPSRSASIDAQQNSLLNPGPITRWVNRI